MESKTEHFQQLIGEYRELHRTLDVVNLTVTQLEHIESLGTVIQTFDPMRPPLPRIDYIIHYTINYIITTFTQIVNTLYDVSVSAVNYCISIVLYWSFRNWGVLVLIWFSRTMWLKIMKQIARND